MIPFENAHHNHHNHHHIIVIIIKFKSDLRMSHFKYNIHLCTQHRTKGKFFPVHSIQEYRGSRGISPPWHFMEVSG